MSRKRTAGGAISFRLPLKEDAAFRKKADSEGLTPGEYARKVMRAVINAA